MGSFSIFIRIFTSNGYTTFQKEFTTDSAPGESLLLLWILLISGILFIVVLLSALFAAVWLLWKRRRYPMSLSNSFFSCSSRCEYLENENSRNNRLIWVSEYPLPLYKRQNVFAILKNSKENIGILDFCGNNIWFKYIYVAKQKE